MDHWIQNSKKHLSFKFHVKNFPRGMYKNEDYFCELSLEGTAKDRVHPSCEKVLLFAQQFSRPGKSLESRG